MVETGEERSGETPMETTAEVTVGEHSCCFFPYHGAPHGCRYAVTAGKQNMR